MSVYRFARAARAERLLITLARRGAPQAERDRQAALHFGQSAAALLAAGLCGYLGFLQAHNGKEGPEDELD